MKNKTDNNMKNKTDNNMKNKTDKASALSFLALAEALGASIQEMNFEPAWSLLQAAYDRHSDECLYLGESKLSPGGEACLLSAMTHFQNPAKVGSDKLKTRNGNFIGSQAAADLVAYAANALAA